MSDQTPKNLVVVLLDSLNRHMLEPYGGREFATPQIAAFARDALRFTRHHVGSLPCMPARHDILVGALDFPWRPWGSIEIWEDNIARALRQQGVTTMLASDHPHLFETGGENYHTDFNAWRYERGHESDPWHTTADPTWIGAPALVDEFDPHEPFDTPLPYAGMYDEDWDEPLSIWPPYLIDAVAGGQLSPRTARHIRANYGSKLTMIDRWFGTLIEAIDEQGLAGSTGIILCTDHGHYLGEHDVFGKPAAPVYSELGRIPLLVRWPGQEPRDVDTLTTSVDIHATIADVFGAAIDHPSHGHSLLPVLEGTATSLRELALFGYWGRHVGVTDGRHRYLRGCGDGDNFPLSVWSNRWSTMPIPVFPQIRLPRPDGRATLDRMPGTEVPVIRQPFEAGDQLPFWAVGSPPSASYLYDTDVDPHETENQVGTQTETALRDGLATELRRIDAPRDVLERIGVA
jgi:arylsulfatase A-like enzyme